MTRDITLYIKDILDNIEKAEVFTENMTAGMRDKIAHFYFGVDFKKVWLVIEKDIPVLKTQIKKSS